MRFIYLPLSLHCHYQLFAKDHELPYLLCFSPRHCFPTRPFQWMNAFPFSLPWPINQTNTESLLHSPVITLLWYPWHSLYRKFIIEVIYRALQFSFIFTHENWFISKNHRRQFPHPLYLASLLSLSLSHHDTSALATLSIISLTAPNTLSTAQTRWGNTTLPSPNSQGERFIHTTVSSTEIVPSYMVVASLITLPWRLMHSAFFSHSPFLLCPIFSTPYQTPFFAELITICRRSKYSTSQHNNLLCYTAVS